MRLCRAFNAKNVDLEPLTSRRRDIDMVGRTINEEIAERIVHELCHAAVFSMKLGRDVGLRVSEAYRKRPSFHSTYEVHGVLLTHRANCARCDRSEIRTIAVETLVLDLLPIRYSIHALIDNASQNMHVLPKADIYNLGAKYAQEDVTAERAMRVLDWIHKVAA